jgi:hypothetical protein
VIDTSSRISVLKLVEPGVKVRLVVQVAVWLGWRVSASQSNQGGGVESFV